jgi:hypothetical protein
MSDIQFTIEEKPYQLDGKVVQTAIIDFVTKTVQNEDGGGMLKSAAKAVLGLVLPRIAARIRADRNIPIPPPDMRSPEAKRDLFAYGIQYITDCVLMALTLTTWQATVQEVEDAPPRITGFVATTPLVVAVPSDGYEGIDAPST